MQNEKKRSAGKWILVFLATLSFAWGLAACANHDSATNAVEAYIQALVAKDPDKLSTLSCAAWEEQALVELDAFAGVKTALKDLKCQENGKEGDTTLVSCTGNIVATYGNEDQEFPLDRRSFKAIQDGGEWRMCGYQ
jgi:hypothetical protein